jgi:hypothetical protein
MLDFDIYIWQNADRLITFAIQTQLNLINDANFNHKWPKP